MKANEDSNTKPDKCVDISRIKPNPNHPRKKFDEEMLQELADSLKLHGMLFPILVVDRGDYYQIVSGERRWRAAKMAGFKEVPVIVRKYTEAQIAEISLVENIRKPVLNPIEKARVYRTLIDENEYTLVEMSQRIRKSSKLISNSLKLLELSEDVQDMVAGQQITPGHARELLPIENKKQQYKLAQRIVNEGLTISEVKAIVKKRSDK